MGAGDKRQPLRGPAPPGRPPPPAAANTPTEKDVGFRNARTGSSWCFQLSKRVCVTKREGSWSRMTRTSCSGRQRIREG